MCKGTEFTLTPEFQSEDYRKDRSKYYYVIVLEYEKSEKLNNCQVSKEKTFSRNSRFLETSLDLFDVIMESLTDKRNNFMK